MANNYIGQIVDIIVDRPIGSLHPKFKETIYKINYGYIPNTLSGDNEEVDVYILRVDKPLKNFRGRIVGVIKRLNDVEDKLVAMPVDNCGGVTKEEIFKAVEFQEKYFKSKIIVD